MSVLAEQYGFRYDGLTPDGYEVWSRARGPGREIHVTPRRGSFHALSSKCWCQPEREPGEAGRWVHKVGLRNDGAEA